MPVGPFSFLFLEETSSKSDHKWGRNRKISTRLRAHATNWTATQRLLDYPTVLFLSPSLSIFARKDTEFPVSWSKLTTSCLLVRELSRVVWKVKRVHSTVPLFNALFPSHTPRDHASAFQTTLLSAFSFSPDKSRARTTHLSHWLSPPDKNHRVLRSFVVRASLLVVFPSQLEEEGNSPRFDERSRELRYDWLGGSSGFFTVAFTSTLLFPLLLLLLLLPSFHGIDRRVLPVLKLSPSQRYIPDVAHRD